MSLIKDRNTGLDVFQRNASLSMTFAEAEQDHDSFVARIFGVVAGREMARVTHYRADLARDVQWLGRHAAELLNGTPFFWGFRTTGTSIGTDFDEARMANDVTYRVTVVEEVKYGERYLYLKEESLD